MSQILRLALHYSDELPRFVRDELEQLIAAIQQQANNQIPIDNVPLDLITIDASQIVSGILAAARGGTGVDGSGATDGQLLIGDTGLGKFVLATLTAGVGISITNGPGSITIASTVTASDVGGHLHGLMRILGDGATTTFNLLDIAEYLEHVGVNGSFLDPATFSLSADRDQIVFDAAPGAGQIVTMEYVIANAA